MRFRLIAVIALAQTPAIVVTPPAGDTPAAISSVEADLIPTFFDATVRSPRTQCFMCHHGSTVVARAPLAR